MNHTLRILSTAASSLAFASAFGTTYTDATGDILVGDFPHIDITSVGVTNTSSDLTFVINLNGSPIATNWGKYNVIMRTPGGGTTSSSNGWGRPYSLDGGANRFIGGWADSASSNSELRKYNGTDWNDSTVFTSSITASSISYTVSLASLGLAAGDTMIFDVATSGGGGTDTAVDSLTTQASAWNQQITLTGKSYTVTPVPEPASFAVLGLGALAFFRRRR